MSEQKRQIYGFDNFRLDAMNRQLLCDEQPVPLQGKAFDLLLFLVENRGRLIEKNELLDHIWNDQFVEEANLTVQMSAIRKALGEKKDNPNYIVTVSGRGYRFVADVLDLNENDDSLVIDTHTISHIVIETKEEETNANEKDVTELAATHVLLSEGNGANLTNEKSTSIANIYPTSIPEVSTTILPATPKKNRHMRLWLGITAAFVIVSALAFVLYLISQHKSSEVPFQQITIRQLTNNGIVENAALSPDGKLFVYAFGRRGTLRSLWLGHVTGGEPIELRPPEEVSYRSLHFSPDSSSVYYVVSGKEYSAGALFRLPVLGGAPEKIREGIKTDITFSPDMKQFAFVRNNHEKDASTLIIADMNGEKERELVTRPIRHHFWFTSPAWSPDGKMIAVGAASDDSNAINYEVFVVTIADGKIMQLTSRKFRPILSIAWLRDGSGLIMIGIEQPKWFRQLWHISYPSGEARHIIPNMDDYSSSLGVSADGNSLLAIQIHTLSNIWVAPAAHLDTAKQITFGSINSRNGLYGLEWTPDDKIIYPAFVDKSQTLWLMDANGENKKQLTSAGYIDEHPSITADGRVIVFGSNRSGSFEVWRVDSNGNNLRQLTSGSYNEEPSVSPDGKWVVYISTRDGLTTLWRVPLEGGEPVQLSDRPASWPRVSPDSKLIVCGYTTKLAIIPIEGGQPVKLFDIPSTANFRYGIRWTPDGKAVTYRDWTKGIWQQSLTDGEVKRLEGLPEEKLFTYGWSSDGKQFAFTRGPEIRDVVLIQNLVP